MKTFLVDNGREGESCFHIAVACNSESMCNAVVGTFKSVFSVEEQRTIVQQKYFNQKSVFHRAVDHADVLKVVTDYLSAILSRDEIGAMLKQKDSEGRSILFYLTDSRAFKDLITFLRKILSNDEIKSLVLDKDRKEQTCIEFSISSNNSKFHSSIDVIRSLCDFVKSKQF